MRNAALLMPVLFCLGCGPMETAASSSDALSGCKPVPAMDEPWRIAGGAVVDQAGAGAFIRVAVNLGDGRALRTIEALVRPAEGHRHVPERLPWFSLTAAYANGAFDAIGTAFDPSVALPSYEAEHRIVLDLSPYHWVPEADSLHTVTLWSEGGSGALAGLALVGWSCTYDAPE